MRKWSCWTLLIALLAVGCDRAPERSVPIQWRFVDAALREGAQWEPRALISRDLFSFPQRGGAASMPQATIAHDTRLVLLGYEKKTLQVKPPDGPARDRISVRLPDDAFRNAHALILVPQVKSGRAGWQSLPPVLSRVEESDGVRSVSFDASLPPSTSEAATRVNVTAYWPPEGPVTKYQTPTVEIPAGARLEFGAGVLDLASTQGSVRFAIDVCQDESCSTLFEETVDPARTPEWIDRTLSLESLTGRIVSFRFRTEHEGPGSFTFPVWSDPRMVAPGKDPQVHPNVILVSIDTLRRDHLDVYGYGRETAPLLRTKIADEGMVFESLTAEAATTDASHMTLFTSMPSMVHLVAGMRRGLSVPGITLAEALRNHVYQTAAFTENGPLYHARGFSIGFDRYVENPSTQFLTPSGQVQRTFAQARTWLERHGDRPFFLFLHTFQVHAPYAPPERYAQMFPPEQRPGSTLSPAQAAQVAGYDGEIRYVDDELAALHDWAEARGLNSHTIWIVLSDHGEEFWEHGSLGHATLPFEAVLGVPLIVKGPGVPKGVRNAIPVHHLDLMPTILDLVGAPQPDGLWGESFANLLRGERLAWNEQRPLFSVSWALPKGQTPPAAAVRVGDKKLIHFKDEGGDRYRYYDLEADPAEKNDRFDERREDAQNLIALLDGRRAAVFATRLGFDAGSKGRRMPATVIPIDPAHENKLRALGYIE